ncbi:MAG TPA: hypothetical protein VMU14_18765 [Acidimicrobiales bacterium]|nr:hypothetical protein [Acidimicrobiales bacterium]
MLDALRASGCDVAQGFLLGRRMPIDDLARWLATANAPARVPTQRRRAALG